MAFSHQRQDGFISPYRPAPSDLLGSILSYIASSPTHSNPRAIIDLGCGDGRILIAALRSLPSIERAVGIDLDRALLERAREAAETEGFSDRFELMLGDIVGDEGVRMLGGDAEAEAEEREPTVRELMAASDVVFVYLLPEALKKLAERFVERLENGGMVVSVQWEVIGLERYLHAGGLKDGYHIYLKNTI